VGHGASTLLDRKNGLYGLVDIAGLFGPAGDGYWFWIHTLGGESIDGTPYECEPVPSIPVPIIAGDPVISNGPVI
jgi:hypothetical protein